MDPTTLTRFFEKLKSDPAMREEFAALAARHGFAFDELSDADLDTIAGGIGTWPTPERPARRAPFKR